MRLRLVIEDTVPLRHDELRERIREVAVMLDADLRIAEVSADGVRFLTPVASDRIELITPLAPDQR